jgi:hypothetical protein
MYVHDVATAEIHEGQRWRGTSARNEIVEVVRQVDDWLWLVRTDVGLMVEMTDTYLMSSYEPLTKSEVALA